MVSRPLRKNLVNLKHLQRQHPPLSPPLPKELVAATAVMKVPEPVRSETLVSRRFLHQGLAGSLATP